MTDAVDNSGGDSECNIRVMCRVRPLNSSEEKAGSKFILKFPNDESISISVSCYSYYICDLHLWNT